MMLFMLPLMSSGQVYNRATYSSPIAISRDDTLVWAVNPADDSVSVANPPSRILTGPGIGGGPRLRKFTETGGDLGSQFLIGSFDRGGIYVG